MHERKMQTLHEMKFVLMAENFIVLHFSVLPQYPKKQKFEVKMHSE